MPGEKPRLATLLEKQKYFGMGTSFPDQKEYGPHSYPGAPASHRIDCEYGCGCWGSGSASGGPLGLAPFGGECPGNPVDGILLGGKTDYEFVVKRRISALSRQAYSAEKRAKVAEDRLGEGVVKIAEERDRLRRQLKDADEFIAELHASTAVTFAEPLVIEEQ